MTNARAVFLDRDGTIIEDAGYLSDPAGVRLLPGAAPAIRRLNEHGFTVVVVTNQSGIARGMLTLDEYDATERRLDQLLGLEGARLDAHYCCPHLMELSGPCECRKPGPLLYQQAAGRFGIDLSRSWWVGDRLRDLLPAKTLGGKGILVLTGAGQGEVSNAVAEGFITTRDMGTAVEIVLS